MTIKFVICELDHENSTAIPSILSRYCNENFTFQDGDEDCFNSDTILKFEQYEAAETIVEMAWQLNKTYLGIVLWDDRYPNEIDYSYVRSGKDKMLQVKKNREAE